MPFGIQPIHLILIALLALLLFGPPYLPALSRRLGRWLAELRFGRTSGSPGLPGAPRLPGAPGGHGYLYGGLSDSGALAQDRSPASQVCSLCGTQNPPEAIYCRQCGISLEE